MTEALPVLERWLFDPTAGKVLTIVVGLLPFVERDAINV